MTDASPPPNFACPLCRSASSAPFHEDGQRAYRQCGDCQLVFVPPEFLLAADEERAQYDLHENDPTDARYRAFLGRLAEPMLARLAPGCDGLDFGSGPGPTLSVMFAEAGHDVAVYDCFYAVDVSVFERQYDFITASEVVEHLHDPARDLERLWDCLKPGGLLGIMTQLVRDQPAFAKWHYTRDPTHVSFFSDATFRWLANRWSAELIRIGPSVALFRKTGSS